MRTSYGTRRAWAAVARRAAAAQKNDCCKRHDARRSSRSLRRRRAGAHMGLTRVRAARVQTQARTRGGGRRGITRGQGAHPLWIILVCTGASLLQAPRCSPIFAITATAACGCTHGTDARASGARANTGTHTRRRATRHYAWARRAPAVDHLGVHRRLVLVLGRLGVRIAACGRRGTRRPRAPLVRSQQRQRHQHRGSHASCASTPLAVRRLWRPVGGWCLNAPTGGKLPLVRRVAGV